MSVLANARLLVGRTIVAVDLQSYDDEIATGKKTGQRIHDPRITLDNGAVITFIVQETDNGATYGVLPMYHPKDKK